jgi:Phage gp6-like head-tail connector protein
MTAVTPLALLKSQLNITDATDDALLAHKLEAAEQWVAGFIGRLSWFSATPNESIAAALTEAILQLAAYWYEQREAASFGVAINPIPFGVHELLRPYCEAVTGYVPE